MKEMAQRMQSMNLGFPLLVIVTSTDPLDFGNDIISLSLDLLGRWSSSAIAETMLGATNAILDDGDADTIDESRLNALKVEMGGFPLALTLLQSTIKRHKTTHEWQDMHIISQRVAQMMPRYEGHFFKNCGLTPAASLLGAWVKPSWRVAKDSSYTFGDFANLNYVRSKQHESKIQITIPVLWTRALSLDLSDSLSSSICKLLSKRYDSDCNSFEDSGNAYVLANFLFWSKMAEINSFPFSTALFISSSTFKHVELEYLSDDLIFTEGKANRWLEVGMLPETVRPFNVPPMQMSDGKTIDLKTANGLFARIGSKNILDGVLVCREKGTKRPVYFWTDSKFSVNDVTRLTAAELRKLDRKFRGIKPALEGEHRLIVVTNRTNNASSLHNEMSVWVTSSFDDMTQFKKSTK